MADDDRLKEFDIRVPLISSVFCLCVLTGGIFLVFYVFVPSLSQPWYPIAAFILIGSPWIFWFFTYLYTCFKGCSQRQDVVVDDRRQISRRATTRNISSSSAAQGGGAAGGRGTMSDNASVASSREPEMPLTYSV